MNKKDVVELEEQYIMFGIPKNTVKLEINATTITEDDKLIKVSKQLNLEEVLKARQNFVENIGDDWDAVYEVTEKGRQWLDLIERELNGKA